MASKTGSLRALGLLARQAAAIFIGVAAALAGQEWFERRAERVAEREFLQSVLEALVEVELVGSRSFDLAERQGLVAIQLAGLLARPVNVERSDSIARLAPQMLRYDRSVQSLEAIDFLLDPESLRLVHDASLRSNLSDFRSSVANLRTVLTTANDFVFSEWRAVGDLPPRVVPHPMLVPAPVEGREGRASSGTRAMA